MLGTYLQNQNISLYALAKKSGVAYSTVNYIVNGKTPIDKCSVQTFKRIADALDLSMNELYEKCQYTIEDFEVFKSNIGHMIKENGQLSFIEEILLSDKIETYWENQSRLQAMYLLATVDYLSRINDIPLCDKYREYRKYHFSEKIVPLSYRMHKSMDSSYELDNIIPEFERFGIMEGDILNVK